MDNMTLFTRFIKRTNNNTNIVYPFDYCEGLFRDNHNQWFLDNPLDTSNCDTFRSMFWGCESLTSIPELDTSNGTDFSNMFRMCNSLTSIPELDTSKGTTFCNMFWGCESLTSIPELDTSNGTDFSNMFRMCNSLTSIPELDTSKGTTFYNMFWNCVSLTSIPELNLSNGTTFYNMFWNCVSLRHIRFKGIIPASIYFQQSSKLSLDSIKSILTALANYTGTENEFVNTIYLNAASWDLINADGETSPDGTTWENYVLDKGWNV